MHSTDVKAGLINIICTVILLCKVLVECFKHKTSKEVKHVQWMLGIFINVTFTLCATVQGVLWMLSIFINVTFTLCATVQGVLIVFK